MIYQIPMVIADEYVHAAYGPCRVLGVHGFNNNTADRYLQFHTKFPAALANGDVPAFKSMWFPQGAQSVFGRETFGDSGITFSELLAAVSSTEVNYTAVTNTGLDLTIQVDTDYYAVSGATIVGDLTTGVDEKVIFNNSTGPKKLRRLDFRNGSGITVYPIIQARDSSGEGYLFKSLESVANNATETYLFGPNGGQIEEQAGATRYDGCTVAWSTALPSLSFPLTTNCYIRGVYEA